MLSKKYRLPGYLIPEVIKKGRTIVTPLFVLRFLPLSTLPQFSPEKSADWRINRAGNLTMKQYNNLLFAFIISKKLDKRAVVRNKAKRRLSEAVRPLLPQIKPGWAIIFLAKGQILEADFKTIAQEVKVVLQRSFLFSKKETP